MPMIHKDNRTEYVIYIILWMLALVLPPLLLSDFWPVLMSIISYLILFLVHDLFISRLFFMKGHKTLYLLLSLILVCGFALVHYAVRLRAPLPPMPQRPIVPDPFVMKIVIAVLLLAANLGSKVYFQAASDATRLRMLEKENLEHQIAYLRYQISPHFFMNTLNNIHALVDIDPEQAKFSLVELSRLMRYVLYEGNKPTIPLTKEVEFLRHYVSLMKIRYSESIAVELSLPDGDTGAEVPPLMFATFVENAFKHGVSYAKESFINVRMSVENGKIIFKCINSRNNDNPDGIKGIGLANVRQRLELIYGEKYTLHVDDTPDIYEVLVIIPSNDYDTLSGNR